MLSHIAQIPPTVNCFEFFGFDVLIDNSLRPWLLEVSKVRFTTNGSDSMTSIKAPILNKKVLNIKIYLNDTSYAYFAIIFRPLN